MYDLILYANAEYLYRVQYTKPIYVLQQKAENRRMEDKRSNDYACHSTDVSESGQLGLLVE